MTQRAVHARLLRREVRQLDAALDHHPASCEVISDERLGICLRDEEDEGVTRVRGADLAQLHVGDGTSAEVEYETGAGATSGDKLFAEPRDIEQLERACLHRQRAGLPRSIYRAVDDPERSPE